MGSPKAVNYIYMPELGHNCMLQLVYNNDRLLKITYYVAYTKQLHANYLVHLSMYVSNYPALSQ